MRASARVNRYKKETNQIVKKHLNVQQNQSICKCRFLTSQKNKVGLKQGKRAKKLLDHYDHDQSIVA